MPLTFQYGDKTVQEFVHLHAHGQLNLEPGFQRQSVWTVRDRRKLIESVCSNCPIPSIFLYQSNDADGRLKYDVIDGKQRLESIMTFQGAKGFRGERFSVPLQLSGAEHSEDYDWRKLRRRGHEHLLMGYKVQTVEVSGDLSEIIDLFVRINSTGKRLTGAEKRHARFYNSAFLKRAGRLATRRRDYILKHGIMSAGQISRMKHVELVSELLASIVAGSLLNKKTALDKIIGGQTMTPRQLKAAEEQFTRTLNRVARMFPRLHETRFRNSVDFYSLFMLSWQFEREHAILTNTQRNAQAQALLVQMSNGVDQVRLQQRKARRKGHVLTSGCLPTTCSRFRATPTACTPDSAARTSSSNYSGASSSRRTRSAVSRLNSGASSGMRTRTRNAPSASKSCPGTTSRSIIRPHSKGGRTSLKNAALLCRSCNSRKGNRHIRRRSAA